MRVLVDSVNAPLSSGPHHFMWSFEKREGLLQIFLQIGQHQTHFYNIKNLALPDRTNTVQVSFYQKQSSALGTGNKYKFVSNGFGANFGIFSIHDLIASYTWVNTVNEKP